MRLFVLCCLFSLLGCVGSARIEGFAANGPAAFLYSARTNTVMTANDDGTVCPVGYVVDRRHYVPDANGPFGNGGEILYAGRCLQDNPPAPPEEQRRGERG